MSKKLIFVVLALAVMVGTADSAQAISLEPASEYNPQINPADFTSSVTTNPFFNLSIGDKMVYQAENTLEKERIEILIPGWTKTIMGVETLVFWDRAYVDGELVEDTRDYLAQHKNGDVWYFGESVDNYEDGKLVDHDGAWIAGENGAKPGIWMLANPQVNDEFRVEYYRGNAEDITRILAVNETVIVPTGTYSGCIKTFDWSPIDPPIANKYYCKQVGGQALEVELPSTERESWERIELILKEPQGALGVTLPDVYAKEGVVLAKPSSGEIGKDTSTSEIQETGKDEDEDSKSDDREGGATWPFVIAGLAVLLGVILLLKFTISRSSVSR